MVVSSAKIQNEIAEQEMLLRNRKVCYHQRLNKYSRLRRVTLQNYKN